MKMYPHNYKPITYNLIDNKVLQAKKYYIKRTTFPSRATKRLAIQKIMYAHISTSLNPQPERGTAPDPEQTTNDSLL